MNEPRFIIKICVVIKSYFGWWVVDDLVMDTSKVEGNFLQGKWILMYQVVIHFFFAIRFLLFFIIQCGKYILVRRCNSLKDICPTVIGFQRFLELWYSNIFFLMPREMGVIMSCYCRYCVVFLALQGFFLFGFTRMWHLIDVGYKSSANKTCWIWFRLSWLYRKKGVKFNQFSRQEAEKKSGQW